MTRKRNAGFTLLELLIVIGIIAILGGVMLAQFSGSTESAMSAVCMNNLRTLCNAAMANGTKESYYPAAGPYQYIDMDDNAQRKWEQGWIGHAKGDELVSCYHASSDEGESQHYAITNGTVWRTIGGKLSAYVCPLHRKLCSKKKVTPSWSYVVNSYFGWWTRVAAERMAGRRSYGGGSFPVKYSSAPKSRDRPIERVLLFAELPFAENGVQEVEMSTSAGKANDMVLNYRPTGDENKTYNYSTGGDEAIGFNHRAGKTFGAHVAFADGHCVRLSLPVGAGEDNLKDLTTWLCTGLEYTFNGSRYEKVSE